MFLRILVLGRIFSLVRGGSVFAQNECGNIDLQIVVPYALRQGISQDIRIISSGNSDFSFQKASFQWSTNPSLAGLKRNGGNEQRLNFPNLGLYQINVRVEQGACVRDLKKSVNVYRETLLYLEDESLNFVFAGEENIKQKNIFLEKRKTDDDLSDFVFLGESGGYDTIFLNIPRYALAFDFIDAIIERSPDTKHFILITAGDKELFKKFTAQFAKKYQQLKLGVVHQQEFVNILYQLSVGESEWDQEIMPLIFQQTHIRYSLSYFLDYLLFQGLPIDFVRVLFMSVFLILVLVFIKHVVGLRAFQIYYPLLSALLISSFGWSGFALFFVLALISTLLVYSLTQRVSLLANARTGLIVSVTVVLLLLSVGFSSYLLELVMRILQPHPWFGFVGLLVIVLMVHKTFYSAWDIGIFKSLKKLIWFIALSSFLALCLRREWLQTLVIKYPEIIFVVLVGIFLFGRNTALLWTEYIRFWPLIRYTFFKQESKRMKEWKPRG